ncbi:helix-turn-helix domain-containing protein [Streptomyces sp. FH025]|uniref:helix-turn-helix domain-containing protein n=1 Tax=Streptomyces sp. FH025 TaxID=2815937 RepID=UPI001FAE95EB|nr:helix-turn-helix domain-containing protein [Streptomyces sp. FH025]
MAPSSANPPGRLRRDAQRNRDLLLAAARDMFSRHGLDVPLDQIAKEAGVGNATLYRHFPTREALIAEVFADAGAGLAGAGEEALAAEDAWTGLERYFGRIFELVAADRGINDLVTQAIPAIPGEQRPTAAVGIASAYGRPAATTGDVPLDHLATGPSPVPVFLVCGTKDDVVEAEYTHRLNDVLAQRMSAVELLELPTDHAGVVMTVYDLEAARCLPATDPDTLHAGRRTAAVLARAAGLP